MTIDSQTPKESDQSERLSNLRHYAASYLFDTAIVNKDWNTAEEMIKIAGKENTDGCKGGFFTARLFFAKAQY